MNKDPINLTRQTYDQIASRFAAATAQMPDAVAERAVRFLSRLSPGGRVLDLGCGPGRDKAWFEAHGVQVIGADLSKGMLAEARKGSNAHLCQMEMRSLGFSSECFTGVWCNAALLHLPKREVPNTLVEIYRVLSPRSPFYLSLKKGAEEGIERGSNGNMPRYFARYDEAEMGHQLTEAGFAVIRQDISLDETRGISWLWYETLRMD